MLENPLVSGDTAPDERWYWGIPETPPPGTITIPLAPWSELDHEDALILELERTRQLK